jgi:hypothetical protein
MPARFDPKCQLSDHSGAKTRQLFGTKKAQ